MAQDSGTSKGSDLPASIQAAIADLAAGRKPNAATARSKGAAPYIREQRVGLGSRTTFRLTKLGREVANGMV